MSGNRMTAKCNVVKRSFSGTSQLTDDSKETQVALLWKVLFSFCVLGGICFLVGV